MDAQRARGPARPGPGPRRGFTLLELVLVMLVLGIAALVAIPSVTSVGSEKLDLAAVEVAGALRFARGEALRTGVAHGVEASASAHRLRVFRLNAEGDRMFDVRHPLDKKLYDLSLAADALTAGVRVSVADFRFGGVATARDAVAFDGRGEPVSPLDRQPLDQGQVVLSRGAAQRSVVVQPRTGRVTLP